MYKSASPPQQQASVWFDILSLWDGSTKSQTNSRMRWVQGHLCKGYKVERKRRVYPLEQETWRILLLSSETYKAGLSYPIKIKRRLPAHCIRKAATQLIIGKGKRLQITSWRKKLLWSKSTLFPKVTLVSRLFSSTKISSKLHSKFIDWIEVILWFCDNFFHLDFLCILQCKY